MSGSKISIKSLFSDSNSILPMAFFAIGLIAAVYVWAKPLGDFGNYYYGAQFIDAVDYWKVYDVYRFNTAVEALGQKGLFLDHTSVPPQTPLFYLPFSWIKDPFLARGIFNFCGLIAFAFSFRRLLRIYPHIYWGKTLLLSVTMLFLMYQNMVLGQTYLFITALLIEAWLAKLRNAQALSGLFLAIAVSLKITPVIILLYFIAQKKFRTLLYFTVAWIFIAGISVFVVGIDVFQLYYLKLLPRIMDGYVNYPYSETCSSFIVFLRKIGQFDAVLNPQTWLQLSPTMIGILNMFLILPLLILVILRCEMAEQSDVKPWLLLFVLLNLSSGYNSIYSWLTLLPFFFVLKMESRRDRLALILIVFLVLFPAKLLSNGSLFLVYSKLWIGIALLLVLAFPMQKTKVWTKSVVVFSVSFLILQFLRIMHAKETATYTYYHPEVWQTSYLLDYALIDDSLVASTWGVGDTKQIAMLLPSQYQPIQQIDSSTRNPLVLASGVLIKKQMIINDTLVFLSDAGRGVGLYHLFCIPNRKEAIYPQQ